MDYSGTGIIFFDSGPELSRYAIGTCTLCLRERFSFWDYGAPEGTRKLKSFEWLDCTNNKVLNVATAQTIKFRMSRLHKQ